MKKLLHPLPAPIVATFIVVLAALLNTWGCKHDTSSTSQVAKPVTPAPVAENQSSRQPIPPLPGSPATEPGTYPPPTNPANDALMPSPVTSQSPTNPNHDTPANSEGTASAN